MRCWGLRIVMVAEAGHVPAIPWTPTLRRGRRSAAVAVIQARLACDDGFVNLFEAIYAVLLCSLSLRNAVQRSPAVALRC